MTPQEIQAIANCLMKRVIPRDAEEGVALSQLAHKLVSHFAAKQETSESAPLVPPKRNGAHVKT